MGAAARARAGWRRDDVPRVSRDAEDDEAASQGARGWRPEVTRRFAALLSAAVSCSLVTAIAQNAAGTAVQTWPIREGVHMLVGPGANTTVQVGRDGVLVVDSQTGAASAQLLAAIRRLSDRPVRFIVNTSGDDDHVGGNEAIAKSGQTLAGGNTRPATVAGTGGAPIFAHENVVNRLSGR